jgi:hypothetical protein
MDCNCKVLFYTVIGVIIFFIFVLPYLDGRNTVENWSSLYGDANAPIDSSNDNITKLDQKLCSPDCCKHTQWLPEGMNQEKNKNITDNYVGTNLTCNNGTGGGCVCMKKNDVKMLQNKAGNSMPSCSS